MPTKTSGKAASAKSGGRTASQNKSKLSDASPSHSSARQTANRAAGKTTEASGGADKAGSMEAGATKSSKARPGKSSKLTPSQIEHFRSLLLAERARLEEEREQIRSRSGAVDGALPEEGEGGDEDTADLASAMMDKEMDLSVEDEIEDLLTGVDHALQKIEDGTYGICDMSGEPIPTSRLELIPWATLTVECQALAEGQ